MNTKLIIFAMILTQGFLSWGQDIVIVSGESDEYCVQLSRPAARMDLYENVKKTCGAEAMLFNYLVFRRFF